MDMLVREEKLDFGFNKTKKGITMQCTGAAKSGVFKWTITRLGPVIADVGQQNPR